MAMSCRDRDGREVRTYDAQAGIIRFLYDTAAGCAVTRLLVRPWISKAAGRLLSSRASAVLIRGFVKKNGIRMEDYLGAPYRSYNDFFSRRIRPELRPAAGGSSELIAPCDAKLSVYPIGRDSRFEIKGVEYTLEALLRNAALAEKFCGGTLMLFRLTVDDYHRYCYPADGEAGAETRIPGVLHTVNPRAAEKRAIYRENSREFSLIETDCFGTLLMMEVGALLVGKIVNHHGAGRVRRGEEKGFFQFGGSSVVLCLEQGRIDISPDILENSACGAETVVKMGEVTGLAPEEAR